MGVYRRGQGLKRITGVHRVGEVVVVGVQGLQRVALGVSIEGNRGSRICAGRAVRRGHGEIS